MIVSSPNPVSNTGLNSQSADVSPSPLKNFGFTGYGVDWATLILRFPSDLEFREIISFVIAEFGDRFDWSKDRPHFNGRQFEHFVRSVRGCSLHWNENVCGIDCMIMLNGQTLAGAKDQYHAWQILFSLSKFTVRCNRLDLNADFGNYEVMSELRQDMDDAFLQGNFSGFRKSPKAQSREWKDGKLIIDETFYMGSRESNKFMRMYDRYRDNGDKYMRFEGEYKGKAAHDIFSFCLSTFRAVDSPSSFESLFGQLFRDILFNSVDFLLKTNKNLNRCERLPFWKEFMEYIQAQPFKLPSLKKEKIIQKSFEWIARQVEPTLALINEFLGEQAFKEYLGAILRSGKRRLTDSHFSLIDVARIDDLEDFGYDGVF